MAWNQWMGAAQSFSGETVVVCYTAYFTPMPNAQDCGASGTYSSGTYTASELFPWADGMGYTYWIGSPGPGGAGEPLPLPGGFVSGGGASAPSGSVVLQPFEFTPEQQADVYAALAVVFGLFLAAMSLVWGYKQILKVLSVGAPGSD